MMSELYRGGGNLHVTAEKEKGSPKAAQHVQYTTGENGKSIRSFSNIIPLIL